MGYIKTEIEGIIRDTKNQALLNTDNNSLDAYKKIRKKSLEMEEVKNKVNSLDKEVNVIKSMLKQILEKLS
jgi:hypothetical protein